MHDTVLNRNTEDEPEGPRAGAPKWPGLGSARADREPTRAEEQTKLRGATRGQQPAGRPGEPGEVPVGSPKWPDGDPRRAVRENRTPETRRRPGRGQRRRPGAAANGHKRPKKYDVSLLPDTLQGGGDSGYTGQPPPRREEDEGVVGLGELVEGVDERREPPLGSPG